MTKETDDWLDDMAAKAEAHRQHILAEGMNETEAFAYIEEVIDAADVAFGVWADPSHANGYDFYIIKGAHLLAEIAHRVDDPAAAKPPSKARTDAVPCACYEHALAAKDRFETKLQ